MDNLELAGEGLLASGDPLVDVGGDSVAHNQQVETHQPPEQPIDLRDGSDSKSLVDFELQYNFNSNSNHLMLMISPKLLISGQQTVFKISPSKDTCQAIRLRWEKGSGQIQCYF